MAYSPIYGWNGTNVSNISGAPKDPVGSLTNARNEAYGLARGAVKSTNPQDQAILAMLQQRAGADGGPYDAATRNAMMTQASDAAGYAALNAKGKIQGSAGDPSVIAANNEADARRSAAIQQAQLGINSQANVANYDARGQAIGQLTGVNQMVQNRQTDNQRYLIDMLRQEQRYTPGTGGGVPSYAQHVGMTMNTPDMTGGYAPSINGGQQNRVNYDTPETNPVKVVSGTGTAIADNAGWKPTETGWTPQGGTALGGVTPQPGLSGSNQYQFYQNGSVKPQTTYRFGQ